MKRSIDHKALTMILGILVALLVAISLWAKTPQETPASRARLITPKPVLPTVSRSVISTTLDIMLYKN